MDQPASVRCVQPKQTAHIERFVGVCDAHKDASSKTTCSVVRLIRSTCSICIYRMEILLHGTVGMWNSKDIMCGDKLVDNARALTN